MNVLNNQKFTEEERRISINFEQLYDNWIDLEQIYLKNYNFSMHWKTVSDKKYLYKKEKSGIEKSLGIQSEENNKIYRSFQEEKEQLKDRISIAKNSLGELVAQYRLLKLPRIDATAGKILREFDKNEILGNQYLVVGTLAFTVYALHASKKYEKEFVSTLDFDLTWFDKEDKNTHPSGGLLKLLRNIDPSFNMNHKKPYQAKNASGYEVELLCAPSIFNRLQKQEKNFSPHPLLEQEWLIKGTPVRHIILDTESAPTPVVAPDPRWMALHKLWLSEKPERSPIKKPKVLNQALYLMELLTKELFIEYPMNINFMMELPQELKPVFDKWCKDFNYVPSNKSHNFKW